MDAGAPSCAELNQNPESGCVIEAPLLFSRKTLLEAKRFFASLPSPLVREEASKFHLLNITSYVAQDAGVDCTNCRTGDVRRSFFGPWCRKCRSHLSIPPFCFQAIFCITCGLIRQFGFKALSKFRIEIHAGPLTYCGSLIFQGTYPEVAHSLAVPVGINYF